MSEVIAGRAPARAADKERFLAASVVQHDDQIDNLIKVAEKHQEEIAELRRSMAETDRLWQAYLKRLPPQ